MRLLNLLFLLITIHVFLISDIKWADGELVNVTKLEMFVDELPDMPKIYGFEMKNGVPISKSLEIGMFMKKWKFHRDLPSTPVFAYGTSLDTATIPGPTIETIHGVQTSITWQNHLPPRHILPWDPTIPTAVSKHNGVPTVVHVHGGIHEPQSDGNANAWFTNQFTEIGPTWSQKTYSYNNKQHPGTLWYHDHAMGLTRVNLLAGLIGAYIIRDPSQEGPLQLPLDQPLIVFDRSFYTDGSIYMNRTGNNPTIHPTWRPEYFGDVIIVNGKVWPRMTVHRRKYRFRIINASNARYYRFYFTNGLSFVHVGSDSAYLPRPVEVDKFVMAPSEIADVIVDFSTVGYDSVLLANDAPYPFPSGTPVDEFNSKIMKFVIKGGRKTDMWKVPSSLIRYPTPESSTISTTRYISMYEYTSGTGEPTHLYINGKSYDEPATEIVKVGSTEIWDVINLTADNHPLHVHLGLLGVLDQRELVNVEEFKACMMKMNDAMKCHVENYARGDIVQAAEHERGWKNVVKMSPGFLTRVVVRFAFIHSDESYPFDATAEPGYAYHCHILDHEDNVMIRPLKLVS
ncbi:hypothetical protein Sjap_024884 [Stephania japonica]|uniref:Uncharacterized protein n=1 Tax=Stephania japonica TaxID=461633 RepID=A0AAP0HP59_9MAGN